MDSSISMQGITGSFLATLETTLKGVVIKAGAEWHPSFLLRLKIRTEL